MRRLKWVSGQAFQGLYDAAPTPANASQFLRIDGIDLVINCKRCAPQAEALSNQQLNWDRCCRSGQVASWSGTEGCICIELNFIATRHCKFSAFPTAIPAA